MSAFRASWFVRLWASRAFLVVGRGMTWSASIGASVAVCHWVNAMSKVLRAGRLCRAPLLSVDGVYLAPPVSSASAR